MTRPNNPYDKKYTEADCYWGTEPSSTCEKVIEFYPPGPGAPPRLLDLGCGEGRNAIHLARKGYDVVGLDSSPAGLGKTRTLSEQAGVTVQTIRDDIVTCELASDFDILFSTGTMQYLPLDIREDRFAHFKEHTAGGGIHVISVLVEKPFIPRAPDHDPAARLFLSGELMSYYWDWEILFTGESVFDCTSGGIPHRHCANRIVARKLTHS